MSTKNWASHNPFTPTFGCVPQSLAGRDALISDIMGGLDNAPGDPNRATILIGSRGSGKTVLLATIVEHAQQRAWVGVNVTSGDNLLDEIIVQVRDSASHLVSQEAISHITRLELAGFGAEREIGAKKTTWRSEITALVKELNEKGVGLLVAVDEVSPKHEALRAFVDIFQHLVSERRDVAMMLAGLPSKVSLLLQDDDVSFLRRAFQHRLDSIPTTDAMYAIKETIEQAGRTVSVEALEHAAAGARGFAFLIQLVGYHAWRQEPDSKEVSLRAVKDGLRLAKLDMDSMVLGATVNELTAKELEYVVAMAHATESSKTAAIADKMGISIENASNVRASLIEKGIVFSPRRGEVDFELPMLREYLQENFEIVNLRQ